MSLLHKLANRAFIATLFLSFHVNVSYALDSDRDQPLSVNSASMDVDLKKHITIYRGNVVAVQGSTTLTADTLTLYADKNNKLEKAIAEGNPATYQTIPSPDKAVFHAEARTIEYYLKEQLIILIKHAKLIQGENSYLGPRLIYNIKNETVTSPPSTEGRATIIMNPKAKNP